MDSQLLEKVVLPYYSQLTRLSEAFNFPLPFSHFSFSDISGSNIYNSAASLQRMPSAATAAEADYLIDLLIPYRTITQMTAGMGANYLPQTFWASELGQLVFQHYLYGYPSDFLPVHEASTGLRKRYGKQIQTGNISDLKKRVLRMVQNRQIPYYSQFSAQPQTRPLRYVRLDYLAQQINPSQIDIPKTRTSTGSFVPVAGMDEDERHKNYKPWLRQLTVLHAAFGLSAPQPFVGEKSPIADCFSMIKEALDSKAKQSAVQEAVVAADHLVDMLCVEAFYPLPLPGWGATYVDLLFWSTEAGEKIIKVYEKAFCNKFHLLSHIPAWHEKPSAFRQKVYQLARRREIPVYPQPKSDSDSRSLYCLREDHMAWEGFSWVAEKP